MKSKSNLISSLPPVRVAGSEPVLSGDLAGADGAARRAQPRARRLPARHRQLLPAAQDTIQLHRLPQLHRSLRAEGCPAGQLLAYC